MGKEDGRPEKSLGNPLNMLKNLRVEALSRNLKHTIFFILSLNEANR